MEKGKKKLIVRILSTAAVLAIAIAICTFVAKTTTEQVEARTNILRKVSDKYTGGDFKILEVVPEHTANENEEIGYFVEDSKRDRDFREVSQAKSIGSLFEPEKGISNLLMMRDYGLIKDYGVDYGNRSGFVSDNPVYSDSATFASYPMTGFDLAEKQFVAGMFEMDPGNVGNYQMDTSRYFIDSSGTINAIKSVSNNTVSSNQYNIGGGALTRTLSVIANTDGVTEEPPASEAPAVNDQDEVTVTLEDEEPAAPEGGNGENENKPGDKEPQSPQTSPDTENQPAGNLLQEMEIDNGPAEGGYSNRYPNWLGAGESNYEPVAEGDRFNKGLPEGITWVGNGTGNVRFVESPVGKYFGYAIRDLYYNTDTTNNYYHNGSWFKELVFGDANASIQVSVRTATPGEITASGINTRDYDLVYISGRNEVYIQNGEDFTDSQVMDLYNAVVGNSHQAVIMDYALVDKEAVEDKAALGTLSNIEKLALLLWQDNQTEILKTTLSGNGAGGAANNGFDVSEANGQVTMLSFGSVSNTVWHYLATNAPFGGYGNFVAGSVYVYEHRLQYFQNPKAQVDLYDFFGNGDFNSPYVDTVVGAGLSRVEYAVRVNNTNNPDKKMNEQITPAVVVQYILSYDGTASELVKNDLRILEIEPCRDFSYNIGWGTQSYSEIQNSNNVYRTQCCANREEFIKRYLGEPFVKADGTIDNTNIDKVLFTSMTIEEFICKNDNVSEEYDIIYIGSNHSRNPAYKTYPITYFGGSTGNYKVTRAVDVAGKSGDTPEYITDFRDNLMDGMVYYNIGDVTHYERALPGSWGGTLLWGWFDNNYEQNHTYGRARFAARDLTVYKMNELLDYLDNGYPIIVAGDMLKTDDSGTLRINPTINTDNSSLTNLYMNGVDHGRIDNCSMMYELFQKATDEGYANFISEADAVAAAAADPATAAEFKERVIRGVNAAKLSLNVTSRPTEYEYTLSSQGEITGQQTLAAESDGKYYLEFEFTLQNFSVNSTDSDIYTPKLYVDVNADGKFSETEQLEGGVVTNALTGVEVPHTTTVSGSVYELSTNVLYRLKREVPDGFQGCLPWCLKVEKSLNPKVSDSETGYSAIKGTSEAVIKILQITHSTKSTLDLNVNYGYYGRYIQMLRDLKMFNLQITTIKQDAFGNPNNSVSYKNVNEYDMLVLGFGDNYADTNQEASNAIGNYIASGKPVLLCHDFMEHYPHYAAVKTLRDMLGMDRYGIRASNAAEDHPLLMPNLGTYIRKGTGYGRGDANDATAIETIETSGRRVAYQPGSNKTRLVAETHGFTNYFLMKFYKSKTEVPNGQEYFPLLSPDMYKWTPPPGSNANQDYIIDVDKVNDGQITNYPYKLPDAFPVNATHGQYYQPNMEADQDDDGTADITIWYTLGHGHGSDIMSETTESKLSDGVYGISPKDGVNNYYIFNSGNVTYTGSGHSGLMGSPNQYEAQLFINTLVAAYRAGIRKPTVSIYDGSDLNSSSISDIVVPYDENIGLNADTRKSQSSFIRDKDDPAKYQYPFVGVTDVNATKVWFRVSDPNLIKGTKKIKLKFWREVPDGTPGAQDITLDDESTTKVIELRMPFYSADFTQTYVYGTDYATGGVMYGLRLPMDLLNSSSNFKLYVEAETEITSISITGKENISTSGKTYASLGVTKMDLLKLD